MEERESARCESKNSLQMHPFPTVAYREPELNYRLNL